MWENAANGTMFREIIEFKKERNLYGYSIMEVVMMFCEELDKDVEEVGEALKKDKSFRETFKEDLKFNNQARFEGETKKTQLDEWI